MIERDRAFQRNAGAAVTFLIAIVLGLTRCGEDPLAPDAQSPVPRFLQPASDCDTTEDLRTAVDDLEADGTLNSGRATALRAKLDQADRWEAEGRPDMAADALQRLIEQIESWVAEGALSEEDAEDLLACAEDVADGPDVAPVIDGIKSPGEWDAATAVAVFTGATFYYMNDDENLYLAFEVADPDFTSSDAITIRFDNTLDGVLTPGDDKLGVSASGFFDAHFGIFWGLTESQQDGDGAASGSGGVNFFEISHPLDSGDPNDFELTAGSTVGYCLSYFQNGVNTGDLVYPAISVAPDENCRLFFTQQSLYAVLTIDP